MKTLPIRFLRIPFFLIICSSSCFATQITFFLRPYPFGQTATHEELKALVATPGKLAIKTLRNRSDTRTTEGIFSTYWGYITASDFNGQVRFPLRQQSQTVHILVTERITPIVMIGNTIHHWEIDPSTAAVRYAYTRSQDAKTNVTSWKIEKVALPENNRIQLDTIVLFAKPSSIYIPEGIIPVEPNPNLILPPIYVKKNINSTVPALWMIKMRQFFKPITQETKKVSETYYSEQLVQ
ncbi:MAG TPA: hypothetical protein VHO47_01960 [Candidatus Babeliales bacterium]|nr:hypothetical protein [Candidatus Babeliales bacterium]